MKDSIIQNIAFINWTLGLFLLMMSNASGIIYAKSNYRRTGWRKYYRGFSVREIRKVIDGLDDALTVSKLRKKILFRQIAYCLLLSTPILLMYVSQINSCE